MTTIDRTAATEDAELGRMEGFGELAPRRSRRDLALQEIEVARRSGKPKDAQPVKLPLSSIVTASDALGVRGEELWPAHLDALGSALRRAGATGDLDPILVMPMGRRFVVVDGHYRREVYRLAGRQMIPVSHFDGTAEEALLHACRIGGKAVLPLRNEQRQNLAWELTIARRPGFSRKVVAENTGVSTSQVSEMRRTMEKLGDEAVEFTSWWKARKAANGDTEGPGEMTEDELDARASDLADLLHKQVGPRFARSPELAARTLVRLIGETRIKPTIAAMASLVGLSGEELEELIHDDEED